MGKTKNPEKLASDSVTTEENIGAEEESTKRDCIELGKEEEESVRHKASEEYSPVSTSSTSSIRRSLSPPPSPKEGADFIGSEIIDDQLHRDFTRGLLINWQLFATADKQEQNDILREQLNLTPEEIEILIHQYMAELSTIYFKEEKKEAGQIEYEKVDNITAKLQQPDEHAVLKLLSEKFKDPIFCSIEPKLNLYKKDKDGKELFLDIYISAFASIANQQFYPYPGIIKLSFVLDFNAPGLDKKKPGTGFKYLGCKQEVSKEDRSSLAKEDQLLARILTNDPAIASEDDIIAIYQESLLDKITRIVNSSYPWEYYDAINGRVASCPIVKELQKTMKNIVKETPASQLNTIISVCKKVKPANSSILVQQLSELNYFDLDSILKIDQELDYANILRLTQRLIGNRAEWSSAPCTSPIYLIGQLITDQPAFRSLSLKEQAQQIKVMAEVSIKEKKISGEFGKKLTNALWQIFPPDIIDHGKFQEETNIVKTVSARKRAINLLEELSLVQELTKIIGYDDYWKNDEGYIAKIITDLQTKVKDPKFEQLTATAQLAVLRDIAAQWPTERLSEQEIDFRATLINPALSLSGAAFKAFQRKVTEQYKLNYNFNKALSLLYAQIFDDNWWKLFNNGKIPKTIMILRQQFKDENFAGKPPFTKIRILQQKALSFIEMKLSTEENFFIRNLGNALNSLDGKQYGVIEHIESSSIKQKVLFKKTYSVLLFYMSRIIEGISFNSDIPQLMKLHDVMKSQEIYTDSSFMDTKSLLEKILIVIESIKENLATIKSIKKTGDKHAWQFCKDFHDIFNFLTRDALDFEQAEKVIKKLENFAKKHKISLELDVEAEKIDYKPLEIASSANSL